MNLDQTIVNWGFSALGALVAFIVYGLRDENKARKDENSKLAENLAELHQRIARDYVRRDDYRDDIAEMKGMLVRIFDLIDKKADKP